MFGNLMGTLLYMLERAVKALCRTVMWRTTCSFVNGFAAYTFPVNTHLESCVLNGEYIEGSRNSFIIQLVTDRFYSLWLLRYPPRLWKTIHVYGPQERHIIAYSRSCHRKIH